MSFRELRQVARVLARRPLFTAVAAVTIALGLGAVTAIASFAKAVFFDPLPYRQPERLVSVATSFPERGVERQSISYPDYLDWREESDSFEELVAYSAGESLVFQGEDRAELLGAELVSRGYFPLLGVELAHGRSFTAEEAVTGAERVVIVGHDFWRRQLGADPAAVGRTVELNDAEYRIVGVVRTHPHRVLPGFFRTLGIPLLAGRDFTDRDDHTVAGVVIVSETMAERLWPGESALGRRVRFNLPAYADRWMEVVGVVGDAEHRGLLYDSDSPDVYLAFRQLPGQRLGYVIRTGVDPASLIPAVRDTLRDLDPHLPVDTLETLDSRLAADLAQPRFRVLLLGLFAAVAVALALVGLYGLMASSVVQRRREIGIRMAIGADRGKVLRLVLGEGLRLALLGILLGLAGALAATRLVAAFLYGTPPNDPGLLATLTLLLLLTALLATLVPAWRASRVDPMATLREE